MVLRITSPDKSQHQTPQYQHGTAQQRLPAKIREPNLAHPSLERGCDNGSSLAKARKPRRDQRDDIEIFPGIINTPTPNAHAEFRCLHLYGNA